MFTRLLEEARADPEKVAHIAHSNTTQRSRATQESPEDAQVREIVHELSEFLFDIFDANCLPAYQAIEAVEQKFCRHFATWEKGEELDHVMHDAWTRFTCLFEKLVEDFLREHDWTNEVVYRAAKRALEDQSLLPTQQSMDDPWQQNPHEQAAEILEVVMGVQDINIWASQMRELHERINESDSSHK